MIAAGKLRHRITIQQPAITQDAQTGEITEGWSTFAANLPAAIEPLSARDFIQSAAMQSEITTRITVRYLAGIKPAMRIVDAATGSIYNIRGVLSDKDSGRAYITMPCDEVLG
jgi:SPP1 family predicted phage head-tail adaptor